ncbi:hypothetical protein Tco_1481917 [Tanacetum coccineum]
MEKPTTPSHQLLPIITVDLHLAKEMMMKIMVLLVQVLHLLQPTSLKPLDYQRYDITTSSEQDDDLLFERQTELLNKTQEILKEVRGGFKSFGKALRGVFGKKKK